MSWVKYIAPLVGKVEITCDYCYGRGRNSRKELCWPCHGTGQRLVSRQDRL
jgi:DnaJ-class molecular chaperone